MTANPPAALDPTSTYLHLSEGPGVTALAVTDDFWTTVDARTDLHRGRLITSFHQEQDWAIWELHPHDDEVIVQLSGASTFHLEVDGEVSAVDLSAGQVVVVPKGAWHTADVRQPGQILVITWGDGTTPPPPLMVVPGVDAGRVRASP